jgi:HAE1 family hydrophobic/amphiphilic exporter-1
MSGSPSTAPTPPPGGIEGSGTALFVRRPILAFVLNALIVIAGFAAFRGVEVRELPQVDRPVITVTTSFTGASPETIDLEVTTVIEGAAGRVSGVQSISSSSSFGTSRVTVEFAEDANLDIAASDIRDAVARVQNDLPDDAEAPRIVKADSDGQAVMRLALTSATRTAQELTGLVTEVVEDRLIAVPGVADVQLYGAREEVFRIDVDLTQLAARGLTLADLRAGLGTVNFDSPSGRLSGGGQSLSVRTTATVSTPEAFLDLPIAPGVVVGDVAQVFLGPAPGESILRANGQTGLGLGIVRAAQSNTLAISDGVRTAVAELQPLLPADVTLTVTSDDAVFIRGAVDEVELTLLIATGLVVAIIWLFLGDLRATLIPAVAVPVALVGTVAAIWLAGFSINILTLLALVLATGLVVDDAIVVLENIVRRRSEGLGPRAAAVLGTQQVFFAVVTTSTTLAAVFVPLSFLPGQLGGLFREFGYTLAISVMLSSVTALTIVPAMASRLLGPPRPGWRWNPLTALGRALAALYAASLRAVLALPLVAVTLSALVGATALFVAGGLQTELTPPEDRGVALLSVRAPQGVPLDYTAAKMREIEDIAVPLVASGEVTNVFSIAGTGGDNRGFMVMTLAPWGERTRSQQEIVGQINAGLRDIVGIQGFAISPNSLGIRGAGQGLRVAITGSDYDVIATNAQALLERMQDDPRFGRVTLGYETTQPQLSVRVDRERATDLGVVIDGLGEALQAVLDGRTVGTVFVEDRSFDIYLVSTADPVNDPGDLERVFVRSGSGQMIPISTFVTLEERAVAPSLGREEQLRAVELSASLTPELPLGQALAEVQRLAAELLPQDSRIVPLAEAATLDETNSGLLVVFGFAVLVVLLVLAAQFESFVSAVIIMVTVPFGIACALFAMLAAGISLNVYSQIGLVLLVGVMAKNGILIVEFANQLRDEGAGVRDAILRASTVRLRPVMMTMLSTVLGGVPLITSTGAGAEAREALGWVIVGGLGLATLFTLYLTPVAYLLLAGLSKSKAGETARLSRELAEAVQAPGGTGSVAAG